MSSADVIDTVWQTVSSYIAGEPASEQSVEKVLKECVNNVLRRAMIQHSEDNLTLIIICFRNILEA